MINLEIYMLGNLKILLNGKPLLGSMSNKAAALLCFLTLNRSKAFSREKLSSIFWDSAAPDTARYNLRYTLWSLRKIFNAEKKQPEVILTDKDSCYINPELEITTDVQNMENLLTGLHGDSSVESIRQLEKIKKIYKGDFLEGFYINKSIEFNDWVFFERERLQRIYFDALSRMSKLYIETGDYRKSIDILNEMLHINPLQEDLYEGLIKNYMALGDRNAALSQYRRCCNILREELNISPNDAIVQLHQQIKSGTKPAFKSEKAALQDNPDLLRLVIIRDSLLENLPDILKQPQVALTVSVSCYPQATVGYYCLSDMIRCILSNCPHSILRLLPDYHWKDLSRIEAGIFELTGEVCSSDNLTVLSERLRIFAALEKLLKIIAEKTAFTIHILSIQWIDRISLEFFRYFLFRNRNIPITIIFSGHGYEEQLSAFKEHLPAEEYR